MSLPNSVKKYQSDHFQSMRYCVLVRSCLNTNLNTKFLSSVSCDIVCRRNRGEQISVKKAESFVAKRSREHAVISNINDPLENF